MIRYVLLLTVVPALLVSSALAQPPSHFRPQANNRGTADDQRACQNDAIKLCRNVLGDDFAVLRCFQSQRVKLSMSCRQVLQKYGQL